MKCKYWNEEHQDCTVNNNTYEQGYNQAIADYTDALKNEWIIDSILCATDKYKLFAIFKRIEEQMQIE